VFSWLCALSPPLAAFLSILFIVLGVFVLAHVRFDLPTGCELFMEMSESGWKTLKVKTKFPFSDRTTT